MRFSGQAFITLPIFTFIRCLLRLGNRIKAPRQEAFAEQSGMLPRTIKAPVYTNSSPTLVGRVRGDFHNVLTALARPPPALVFCTEHLTGLFQFI
jgi:hypothetical protein